MRKHIGTSLLLQVCSFIKQHEPSLHPIIFPWMKMEPVHAHMSLHENGWLICSGINELTIKLCFSNIQIFYFLLNEAIGIKISHSSPTFSYISEQRMGMEKGINDVVQWGGKWELARWFCCASQLLNQIPNFIQVLVEVILGVFIRATMDILLWWLVFFRWLVLLWLSGL